MLLMRKRQPGRWSSLLQGPGWRARHAPQPPVRTDAGGLPSRQPTLHTASTPPQAYLLDEQMN